MKRIISLILAGIAVILLAGCTAANTEMESLKFKETNGGYALYRYKGDSQKTSFAVPDKYKGQPVVEIMDFALANAEYLKIITISANIERIGDWAFTNCGALKKYIIDENSKYFKAVDGVLYKKDMTELISFPNGKASLRYDSDKRLTGGSEFIIPESVTKIRSNAFYVCGNLYKVTFNNGLVEIGNKAFIKCINLQNFTLPGTLQTIGVDAFSFCDSLTAVTIPASVSDIGDYAFFSMSSSIKEIIIQRKDSKGLQTGRDWLPKLKDTINTKAQVKYIP